jgi:hypothetical protein
MKRALVVLITLALLAVSATVFAETTIKGTFMWFGNYDFFQPTKTTDITALSGDVQGRVKLDTMVDKFNEIYVELRAEGLFDPANDFYLKNFKLVSDLTGALGLNLPFTAKLTFGYFDTYFTGWWYAESTGWDFYYGGPNPSTAGILAAGKTAANWSNGMVWAGETKPGAMQFDIGVGPVNIHYYNDLAFHTLLAGADATFGPLGVWLAWGVYNTSAFNDSDLSLELKYAFPEMSGFKLNLYPFFRYYLGTPVPKAGDTQSTPFTWGLSAAADYSMFHLGLGAQGDAQAIIDHFFGELSVAPVTGAKIWVNGYFDTHVTLKSILSGIDIGASYKFGAANLMVGYLIGGTDRLKVPLYNDNPQFVNGLYLGADCSF